MRTPALLGLGALCAAIAVGLGCGAVKSDASASSGDDSGADGSSTPNQDGGLGAPFDSGGSFDAGPPNATCPAHYSVYGDQDAADNLGNVNPTLIASASCTATGEQWGDGGFSSTDFTMTFAQSSPRSGMFMATLHQTTPFPYDLTVCLEPDGPRTGSAPKTPGGNDGTMFLTNVPEDRTPYNQYPKVSFDTNFKATPDPDFLMVTLDAMQGFGIGAVSCTFVKNP